jgi:hypothetical protein
MEPRRSLRCSFFVICHVPLVALDARSSAICRTVTMASLRQYDSFHFRFDRRDHFREDHLRREAIVSP